MHQIVNLPRYRQIRQEICKTLDNPKLTPKERLAATQQLMDLYKIRKMEAGAKPKVGRPKKNKDVPAPPKLSSLVDKLSEEVQ